MSFENGYNLLYLVKPKQENMHQPQQNLLLLIVILVSFLGCNKQTEEPIIEEVETRKKIELVTSYGSMVIEFYNETPLHRDNFLNLARNHAYDSLLFHRVIKDFMIQAGDPDSKKASPQDTLGEGDAPYAVKAEFNPDLFHKKGVIAAARDNNPEKSSSAMQFYIAQGKVYNDSLLENAEVYINKNKAIDYFKQKNSNMPIIDSLNAAMNQRNREQYNAYGDSILQIAKTDKNFKLYSIPEKQREVYKTLGGIPHLDQNYTIFGEVIQGLEIIDSIANVETDDMDRPINDVRILDVKILDKE